MVDAYAPDPKLPVADRDLLRSLLQQLGARVRREQLETWFRSLDVVRADDREIELSVTSQFVRDWLQKNYLGILQESVSALGDAGSPGESRRRVLLSHREEDGWDSLRFLDPTNPLGSPTGEPQSAPPGGRLGASFAAGHPTGMSTGLDSVLEPMRRQVPQAPAPAAPAVRGQRSSQLNPNYTFDKFVVGSCNRLAHASALAIGENPGCAYNPLFVHGNVGLGKSHLLQAICHTVTKRDPNARVLYMSCEDFTNSYIQAIQSHQLDAFREFHRTADMLVIDDVQFLANKDKTQDEFFHTFNALYDAQKQIVLSSDRPPVEIPTIEERLVSRFKWGLVAEVETPCFDTRAAIVRRKAKGRGVDLPEEVAAFLAERVTANIRELEGAVIKVVGIAAITEQPITLALAESCMRGMPVRHNQVSADDVMTLITTEFAISARELTGKGRTQTVSLPRQIAMYLLRDHTESSLEDVGRIFGNRDHTTVLYAVTKIRERAQKDRMFKELLEGLSNRLLTRSFRN
ncbi:MAG: chromosomal replication initiator protein DnaA [Planctomycetes bacterium]|jgi:chromosomal replication initiator protein|nr:chromosomal replication initiator protein DnaA [Planctomycetota bacterium]